jgi:Putative DNA-binding domain
MMENREWSEADLQRLADDKVGETLQLEFKACGALSKNPEGKAEVGKDVSAIANAAGGTIIYGIVEKNRVADSIDVGFDPNVYTKEWLEQVIDSNVQPRIEGLRISVVGLPSRQDNVAYVVEVPQAVGRAPHQASDHRYYKRANFQNQMMEDYEIRDSLRRARWPDLYLTWTIHGGIDRQGNRRRIHVTADIDNRSSEPAHYSSYRLYFDEHFRARVIGGFEPHGQQQAPNGEQCNAFVRQMMVPTDFPVIKEQTNRIISLALDLPLETPSSRFVIGSSIRAPRCERDAWQTINYKDEVAILGNYRIR